MNVLIPKYYMVKRAIIENIDMEEYKSDETIPSERELIEQFKVSRITIRKAIDELVNEGYLYKIQGKGTYVKSDSHNQDLFSITSCTEDVKNLGMTPSRKVITSEIIKTDIKRSKILNISPNDSLFKLARVLYADNEPLNYTRTYLPIKLFPKIEEIDFREESLYDVISNKYNTKITRAIRTIEAISAKEDIAEMLEIEDGVPIILFNCTTYGIQNGKEIPIEYFKCYYRTDKCKFYINQTK